MPANEMLILLSKQWCNIEDLMKIAQIGRNRAFKMKKEILNDLSKNGYVMTNNLIPMKSVVDHLLIDISYLEKVSKERM
ncbi:MAG: hypothetical protein R3Y13_03020 [bacterium]